MEESKNQTEVERSNQTDHSIHKEKNLASAQSLVSGSMRSLNNAVDESIQQAVFDIESALDAAIEQAAFVGAESPPRNSQPAADDTIDIASDVNNADNNNNNIPSGNDFVDDSTIGSDTSVDATGVLTGELERAQEMFMSVENKDATTISSSNTTPKAANGTNQNKPKEVSLSPDNDTKEDVLISARGANILSWFGVVVFIVVLFVIYVLTRPDRVAPAIRGSG